MTNTNTTAATLSRRASRLLKDVQPDQAGAAARNPSDAIKIAAAAPCRTTKQSLILDLLRRDEGVLLADIVAATSWQPHTARAALTGLKKKGHTITSTKVGAVTRYKLV